MPYRPDPKTTATPGVCPRCDAPVLQQREGLPYTVTADAARLTPDAAARLVEPNRLAWCLREAKWSPPRLVEVLPGFHGLACGRAHVIDHRCPAGTPAVRGALW
ncbi:hypothetical protein ACH4ZX_03665 [Streptomyces sp. NPDC020490]|uniref:hypothetical protein n=1 Tax=Streptomyces sp. NPDC020490 TaxID=3365078 RepID=UPI0037B7639F